MNRDILSCSNVANRDVFFFFVRKALTRKNCLLRWFVGYVVRALARYGTLSSCTNRYHTCTATTASLLPAVLVPKIQQQQSFLSFYRSEDIKLFPGTW